MIEWRVLPEFPKYEITDDGDVRNRETKKKLNEIQNKRTGAWSYCLRYANGKNTHRAYEGLIHSAWPELAPAKKEKPVKKVRPYGQGVGWTDIPDFPKYQVHPDGKVRYKAARRFRKTEMRHGVEMVLLYAEHAKDGHWRSINGLLFEVFNTVKEAA